ncbi:pantoate--beta-alanine ligase [Xanthobacter agilis]|uniref:pantoate--beta-alanine ligase n=1 Tax=Xanthobacter agilis TaxID=47492 RepID=UPI00372848B0
MTSKPVVVETVRELKALTSAFRSEKARIALVPTMGALHAGHMALVRRAQEVAEKVVVSIFVNPTQFGPTEDFSRYPRTFDADFEKLSELGADAIYAPDAAEMYPRGFSTRITMSGPADGLESDFRPQFFAGVATVVGKLFIRCAPDFAAFGEKDYQQLKVVTRLSKDLDLGVEIVPVPTTREPDGLALSSRNAYLSAEERAIAPVIYTALKSAALNIRGGATPADAAQKAADTITAKGLKVDYVAACHAETLAPLSGDEGEPIRLLAAAWLGGTRLIDNIGV